MTANEIRELLLVYQPGAELFEPSIAVAKTQAESDSKLRNWFEEEQAFDRAFAHAIACGPLPVGLDTRIKRSSAHSTIRRQLWRRRIVLAAAAMIIFGIFFSSWHGPFSPNASLA